MATSTASAPKAAPVKKSADERLNSALKGFAPVVPASVSEAETRREQSSAHVRNLFAGVATQLDPERLETSDAVREPVAKAFSSLKRAQTAFLKAVAATSDEGTVTLPGVESVTVETVEADAAE